MKRSPTRFKTGWRWLLLLIGGPSVMGCASVPPPVEVGVEPFTKIEQPASEPKTTNAAAAVPDGAAVGQQGFLPEFPATNAPFYLDAGKPLPAESTPGTSRPAAVAPEYPTPNVTASQTVLTPYDLWKQKLYWLLGTKYVLSLDFTDHQIVVGPTKGYNRGVARFDLGIDQDLWEGATLSLDARGGVGNGIDPLEANGVNTNQFAFAGAPIFLMRAALYQSFFKDALIFRVGKFDLGDFIDYNRFGTYNFLAYSFAHNTTIPLPGNTLGGMVTVKPTQWLTFQAGFSNVDQAATVPGFNTFGNGDYLTMYELAYVPNFFGQDGTYRFIYWFDTKTYQRLDGTGTESGLDGFVISFDQNITKTFGLFVRYGFTRNQVFAPQQNWSAGFVWTGPIRARPKDTLSLGVLQNIYGKAHAALTPDASSVETLIETYYQYEAGPYISVVPTLQYVGDPGGTHRKGEFIAALHVNVHL